MVDYKRAILDEVKRDCYIAISNLAVTEKEAVGKTTVVLTGRTSTLEGKFRLESIAARLIPPGWQLESHVENENETLIIKSATEHNTPHRLAEMWSIPGAYEIYARDRPAFYEETLALAAHCGISIVGRDILDVGCGLGHLLLYLQTGHAPKSLSGTEVEASIVRKAREKLPDANIFVHDLEGSPIPGMYDVIFCTEVLEHLRHPNKALAHILSAMRKGGQTFLTVPDGRVDTFAGHINYWSEESWDVFIHEVADPRPIHGGRHGSGYLYAIIAADT